MLTSSEIKFFKSLSNKKAREDNSLFVVEGEKLVNEALRSDFEVVKVLYSDQIGIKTMERITLLSAPSPAYALLKMKSDDDDLRIDPKELYLMLDSVKDPGNLGTILRIADWFGIRTIIASKGCVEVYNPKVVQSSMGSIFRVRVLYRDPKKFLSKIKGKTIVYGTYPLAPSIYTQRLERGALILMGGESNGISPDLERYIERRVSIPPYRNNGGDHPESLNVAVATALVCSEFRRPSV